MDRAWDYHSPRLEIGFDTSGAELVVYRPNGVRFLKFAELEAAKVADEQRASRLAYLAGRLVSAGITVNEIDELRALTQSEILSQSPRTPFSA